MGNKRKEIEDHQLEGFKYFKAISRMLERLHDAGCQRDTAGNRILHMDQYTSLILLYMFNPICSSRGNLRGRTPLIYISRYNIFICKHLQFCLKKDFDFFGVTPLPSHIPTPILSIRSVTSLPRGHIHQHRIAYPSIEAGGHWVWLMPSIAGNLELLRVM